MFQKGQSNVVSMGYYLPQQRVKPKHMVSEIDATRFGKSNTLVEDEIGVREVRHASGEKPSDMAVAASEVALEKSGIKREHIDLIIFCGIERDHTEPSTAHTVQHKLGLKGECFDVTNACLGFMSGFQIANAMISAGFARYVLLCTGETPSAVSKVIVDELRRSKDKSLFQKKIGCLSAGDSGAAAIVGQKNSERGMVSIRGWSEGKHANLCYYTVRNGFVDGQLIMGRISAHMIDMHRTLYPKYLEQLEWEPDQINGMITHQVGQRSFYKLRDLFGMTDKKMTRTFDFLGNITSSTFVVNLARALDSGQLREGDKVYAAMAGSGLSVMHAAMVL